MIVVNFPLRNLSPKLSHPHFIIRILSSAFCHPHFSIRHPPSAIRHPPSAIRHSPSAIRHPPSAIRHPPSAIRHPPSAIRRHPPPSAAIRRHPVPTLQRPLRKERPWKPTRDETRWPLVRNNNKPAEVLHSKRESEETIRPSSSATDFTHSVFHRCKFWDWNKFLSSQVFEQYVGIYEPKAPSFRVFDPRGVTRINFTWQLVKFAPITVEIKLVKPIKFTLLLPLLLAGMSADNLLGWEIVLKISHLPSKLRFSAKCSFFGQSLSRGHYQPTYQPPKGVYLLNIPQFSKLRALRKRFEG